MQTTQSPQKQTLKLIDGTFSASEAREVLMNLINSKIQFHNLKNFSSEERFGHLNVDSLNRIEELKDASEAILDFVNAAGWEKKKIVISSFIKMRIEE